jgi:phosphatidylglycerophosphatase A
MTKLTKAEVWAKVTDVDNIAGDARDPYPYLYETATPEKAAALEQVIQDLEAVYEYSYKPWSRALPIEALMFALAGLEVMDPEFRDLSDTDTRECVLDELAGRGVLIGEFYCRQMLVSDL